MKNSKYKYGTIQQSGENPLRVSGLWKPLESSQYQQVTPHSVRSSVSFGQASVSTSSIRNSIYSRSNVLCFRQFRWFVACYDAKFVTIEPIMFIVMFAVYLHKIVFELYTFTSLARNKFSNSSRNGSLGDHSEMCISTTFLNNISLVDSIYDVDSLLWSNKTGDIVETEAGLLNMMVNISSGVCSIFGMLMLGPVSNLFGRKGALCIILGGMLIQMILTAVVVHNPQKVNIHFFVLGAGIRGLTGGVAGIYTVSYSYITELSTYSDKKMLFVWRIGVIETLSFVAVTLGLVSGGVMIELLHCNFSIPAYVTLCGVIFAFLYSLVATEESRNHAYAITANNSPLPRKLPKVITGPKYLIQGISFFFGTRYSRLKLWLILLIMIITVVNSTGITAIMTLFLLHEPLHFSPMAIGGYLGVSEFIHGLVLVLFLPMLLSIGIHDDTIVFFSILMTIAMNSAFGFVDHIWKVFVGK